MTLFCAYCSWTGQGGLMDHVTERHPTMIGGQVAQPLDPWTVPPDQRPICPASGQSCTSWTCLVDVCVDARTAGRERIHAEVDQEIVRAILEALCRRDGLSLDSGVEPGTPARNYELALRLGIGQVFGLGETLDEAASDR